MKPIVYIEWTDAGEQTGWVDKDRAEQSMNTHIKSIGFLIYEDDQFVTFTNSISDYSYNCPMTVPKFAINKRIDK